MGKRLKLPEETLQELANSYDKGLSLNQVAALFDVSEHFVRKTILGKGKKLRAARETHLLNIKPVPEEWREMARLNEQGMSAQEIGEIYFCVRTTVRYRINQVKKRGHIK